MGATLVITSFTCTVPFVGSLLSLGATGGGLARVALGMGVFGATMAVPFVLLSLVPGAMQSLPRSGQWMNTIKVTLGFVEVAAALKFLSNADLAWRWDVLPRELFLVLWAVIFAAAGLYLLGFLSRKLAAVRTAAPARRIVGVLFLLFAVYCFLGSRGRELDRVMLAIAPNYSAHEAGSEQAGAVEDSEESLGRPLVVDDYEAARLRAEAAGVPLFLNFTGFT
jgi:thiol:disulfide interchange protein DsbD